MVSERAGTLHWPYREMDENVVAGILFVALQRMRILQTIPRRIPMRVGGESGSEYIHRLLTTHPRLCQEQLRVDKELFVQLVNVMVDRNLLQDGRFIAVAEQVGIALYILAKGAAYRDAADVFKHSLSTISKYFRQVLKALLKLSAEIIAPYQSLDDVPPEVINNALYWPFFKDCVGAIDGTHIDAVVNDKDGVPYRGRKGTKTWNIMVSCSFDLLITFVNVGWEGSAHDTTIWSESLTKPEYRFPHPPPGKYYLVDSGYSNTLGYLAPYCDRSLRTHLPEFRNGVRPQGVFEHFNYRHSSLRTRVERTFAVLKNRWKILRTMPQIKEKYQIAIIYSVVALHNMCRLHTLGRPVFQGALNIEERVDSDLFNEVRKKKMDKVRDDLSKEIWNSVQGVDSSFDDVDVEVDETDLYGY